MARPRIRALPLGTGAGQTAAYAFMGDLTGTFHGRYSPAGATGPAAARPLTGR